MLRVTVLVGTMWLLFHAPDLVSALQGYAIYALGLALTLLLVPWLGKQLR